MTLASYKDTLLIQIEGQINSLRKKREQLEGDLREATANEDEARALLQTLKTGNGPKMRGGKRIISQAEFTEALEAAGHNGTVFTPGDVAGLLGVPSATAAGRLKRNAGDGVLVEMVEAGGPGIPSKFRLKQQMSKRVRKAMEH
jgi:hypothetical protein